MGNKTTLSLFIAMFLVSCGSESNLDLEAEPTQVYDSEVTNPRVNIYQQDNMVVQSTSKKLLKNDGEDATLVGDVVAKFFNDDGVYISTLYSDSAIVENISNNLRAYGNVKVVSDSGYTLLSDQINWDNQYKLITSKDSVTFTDKSNTTVMGVGFESDMDLTNYKIFQFIGSFEDSEE